MQNRIYGLGKGVLIEAHVDISLGLAIGLSVTALIKTVKEIIMENLSNVIHWIMTSVWCGAAFLRSLVEKSPTQARDIRVRSPMPSKSERVGFDSPPPLQFLRSVVCANKPMHATCETHARDGQR
jgi:hypothetical protein